MGKEFDGISWLSLLFTVVFLGVYTATQWLHRDVEATFPMTSSLQALIESAIQPSVDAVTENATSGGDAVLAAAPRRSLRAAGGSASSNAAAAGASSTAARKSGLVGKRLDSVMAMSDVMVWLEATLVRLLWSPDEDGTWGTVLGFNQAVGGVRLKQRRLGAAACPGLLELAADSKTDCFSGDGSAPIGAAGSAGVAGFVADGKGDYTYWLDIAQDEATMLQHLSGLAENGWLSLGAEVLLIQSVYYNPQVAHFATSEVKFIFNLDGSVARKMQIRSLPTEVYSSWGTVAADLVVVLLLVGLAVAEICGLVVAARAGELRRRLLTCQRLHSLAVVFFGVGFSIFFLVLSVKLKDLGLAVAAMPPPPVPAPGLIQVAGAAPLPESATSPVWLQRHGTLGTHFDEVLYLAEALRMCELSTFWYGVLMMSRILTLLRVHPQMAMLTETMRRCLIDLSWFLAIFLTVFTNFVLGAYWIFGHQSTDWSTLPIATNSAFRAVMGDFDFNSMYAIAPISAVVWFYSYMCVFYLIMLNMLLAIIMDTFCVVKEEAAVRAREQDVLRNSVKSGQQMLRSITSSFRHNSLMGTKGLLSASGGDGGGRDRGGASMEGSKGGTYPPPPPELGDSEPGGPSPLVVVVGDDGGGDVGGGGGDSAAAVAAAAALEAAAVILDGEAARCAPAPRPQPPPLDARCRSGGENEEQEDGQLLGNVVDSLREVQAEVISLGQRLAAWRRAKAAAAVAALSDDPGEDVEMPTPPHVVPEERAFCNAPVVAHVLGRYRFAQQRGSPQHRANRVRPAVSCADRR